MPCALPSIKSSESYWHSEVPSLLKAHRSTRNLPSRAEVVIIGSGITGASVAHHVLNNDDVRADDSPGRSVVMLEAREACWGATGRNGGHCQPLLFEHPHDPSIPNFELNNYHALQGLIARQHIDCEFVAQPGVRAIYSASKLADAELALHTTGQTAPDLARLMRLITSKDELAKLRVPTALGAMYTAVAARMWPYKFVAHILEQLLLSSALRGSFNLQTLTPVESIQPAQSDLWQVQTSRGTILAEKVVLATNAYTSHLLPSFSDLIVPCRGQMSALIPPPLAAGANRLKTSFGFEGDGLDDYLIQRPNETGGQLMFGGGRSQGPSLGVCDDSTVDDKTATYLRERLFDEMDLQDAGASSANRELKATHQWTGIMGFSRDDLPWVGHVPDSEGLYIAAGFTGHGMPNTWLCGKAVAVMIEQDGRGKNQAEAVAAAQTATLLPTAYVATKDRIAKAMALEAIDVIEEREFARAARKARQDRPPSGYA